MAFLRPLACLLAAALLLSANEPGAAALYKRGRKAEKAGRMAEAYLLYSEAAALEPKNIEYWALSQAVRTRAILQSPPKLKDLEASGNLPSPPELATSISRRDLEEARLPQPPLELAGAPGRKSFNLKGDSKLLFERVAKAYGLDCVFDGDYQPSRPIRFEIDDATYREALRAVEAATDSFLAPISSRVFLVAKDTPVKRTEVEPNVAVIVPIPDPVSVQEAQELGRSIQQVMEIKKLQVDTGLRLVLIRDRVSVVRAAQALLEELLHARAEVAVDLQFIEIDRNASLTLGFNPQSSFPLVFFGNLLNSAPTIPAGFADFFTFGGGKTLIGVGVTSAQLFATMSKARSHTLFDAEIRSSDGQTATLHVGDRYPVMTASYSYSGASGASTPTTGAAYATAPSFDYEDLGVMFKVIPHVNGPDEVTLDVEAEFKVLGGSAVNGVPIISSRKIKTSLRLCNDQWAVFAGLMDSNQARTIAGLAGLSNIPFLGPLVRSNTKSNDSTEVLVLLKPRLLRLPPAADSAPAVWIGSDTRPLSAM